MHDLSQLPLWQLTLVVCGIFVGVIFLFGIFVPILKPTIRKKSMIYLYAFATGFFLVLATYGLLRESNFSIQESFKEHNIDIESAAGITIMISILTIGAALGMGLGLFTRYILTRRKGIELHKNHNSHSHSEAIFNYNDIDNPKSKWIAILLLLSHRVVAGLTIGILVAESKQHGEFLDTFSITLILAFIFHIIPEVLIVYYRQIETGLSRKKVFLNIIIFKLAMIPLIFIGAYWGNWINSKIFWMVPLFMAIASGAIAFTSIFELIPECLDNKDNSKSRWYKISSTLISGFIVAIFILSIG